MTAPQPDLPARVAAVEDRVADLEQHQAQVAPFELAAVRAAVGRVHADVLALGEQAVRSGQKLDQVEAEVGTVARSQIEHGAALATLAGKVDGLAHKVDGLSGRVGGLEGKVDAQGATLAVHGEALGRLESAVAEILRRLPAAGE
jgi:hypothetical protein